MCLIEQIHVFIVGHHLILVWKMGISALSVLILTEHH